MKGVGKTNVLFSLFFLCFGCTVGRRMDLNANKGIFSSRAKTSDDHTLLVHTFILSYFQYLKNITHCSTTRSIYILSHIISNQYLSWYITNHCDFLWGEKDKWHVVANRCIPSIPGVLYPHHPMHRNQTCILLQGKNAESYPPGEKSIHEGKMQKSIHEGKMQKSTDKSMRPFVSISFTLLLFFPPCVQNCPNIIRKNPKLRWSLLTTTTKHHGNNTLSKI